MVASKELQSMAKYPGGGLVIGGLPEEDTVWEHLLLSAFVNNTDSGIECLLSNSADCRIGTEWCC